MYAAIHVPNVVLIVDRANLSHVRTSYIDVFRQYLRNSMSVDRDILFGGVESIQIHFAIFSLPLLLLLFSPDCSAFVVFNEGLLGWNIYASRHIVKPFVKSGSQAWVFIVSIRTQYASTLWASMHLRDTPR